MWSLPEHNVEEALCSLWQVSHTALHLAAHVGNQRPATLLLDAGCNLEIPDKVWFSNDILTICQRSLLDSSVQSAGLQQKEKIVSLSYTGVAVENRILVLAFLMQSFN